MGIFIFLNIFLNKVKPIFGKKTFLKSQKSVFHLINSALLIVVLLAPLPILANNLIFGIQNGQLPENLNLSAEEESIRVITAYNSEKSQCDASPCITANGFNVCNHGIEDTVALNFLPLGTRIKIPELFGDKVFVVRDRMNARYPERIDIWMADKETARQFGVQKAKIQILTETSWYELLNSEPMTSSAKEEV